MLTFGLILSNWFTRSFKFYMKVFIRVSFQFSLSLFKLLIQIKSFCYFSYSQIWMIRMKSFCYFSNRLIGKFVRNIKYNTKDHFSFDFNIIELIVVIVNHWWRSCQIIWLFLFGFFLSICKESSLRWPCRQYYSPHYRIFLQRHRNTKLYF